MPNPTINIELLQAQSKLRHLSKYNSKEAIYLNQKIMELTPQSIDNVLFFDGTNIDEVKFLFTKDKGNRRRLKRFDTVVRELSLLTKPRLPNKKKVRLYIKNDYAPDLRPIQRVPIIFDGKKETRFVRPPAQYSNISREEKIDYYLAQ